MKNVNHMQECLQTMSKKLNKLFSQYHSAKVYSQMDARKFSK